jgi:RNA polymerase sigma factor (sigma-70 family)
MAAHVSDRNRDADNRRDAELVRRAQAWDKAAQDALFNKYHAVFESWTRRRFHSKQWLDNYTDAATARVFEVLDRYDPKRSAFCSWAHHVAIVAIFKFIRDMGTERDDVSIDEMMDDALPALLGPEEEYVYRLVYEEVAGLEFEQRVAVEGHEAGYSDEELAEWLNIPRRQVCYRRKQGKAALKLRLSRALFTPIRPKGRFSGYYPMMKRDGNANESPPLGAEGGD